MKQPAWQERDGGTVLPVRAQPGARKNEIRGIRDGALLVAVTQVAEKGKANRAIVTVLAKALRLRKSQISLLTGETSRQKNFFVAEMSVTQLWKRVADLLDDGDGT